MGILNRQLAQPALIKAFEAALWGKVGPLSAKVTTHARMRLWERAARDRKIHTLVAVVSNGRASAALLARLLHRAQQCDGFGAPEAGAAASAPSHPNFAADYAKPIAERSIAIQRGDDRSGLKTTRSLIKHITISPHGQRWRTPAGGRPKWHFRTPLNWRAPHEPTATINASAPR